MTVTTTDHDDAHDDGGDHAEGHEGGHHESPVKKDHKERLALWLFISGDALFLLLELFTWFYLRALNTEGLWRGAACSKANPCTDGLGNPIVQEIQKANPAYSVGVAALAVVSALLVWLVERSARNNESRSVISGVALLAFLALLATVGFQIYQFQVLPFTTIDGSYASTYIFFMGSTLAHLILLTFIGFGLWMRAHQGKYDDGRWFQVRIIRFFAVWIAVSAVILTVVSSLFA
jgi:heme/copper-type cytochrome/quinol oxidase subunit 3